MDIKEIKQIFDAATWYCSPEDEDWESLQHRNREQFIQIERALAAALLLLLSK